MERKKLLSQQATVDARSNNARKTKRVKATIQVKVRDRRADMFRRGTSPWQFAVLRRAARPRYLVA